MEKIKNIIFDLGVVLIDLDSDRSEKAFRSFLNGQYDDAHRKLNEHDVFLNFEKGLISDESFINALQRSVKPAPDPRLIIDAWNAMLIGIPKHRLAFLKELKKKYRLFLLSNTNAIHMAWIRRHVRRDHCIRDFDKYFFEKTYYSFEVKMRKPDKKIYDFVLEDAGIRADETVFIDDSIENVKAARTTGLKAIWLEPHLDVTDIKF